MPAKHCETTDTSISKMKSSVVISPRVWGMAELRAHYPGWSDRVIKRQLRLRVGLRFSVGQRVCCDRLDVDAIDEQLTGEGFARRQTVQVCAANVDIDRMEKLRLIVQQSLAAGRRNARPRATGSPRGAGQNRAASAAEVVHA